MAAIFGLYGQSVLNLCETVSNLAVVYTRLQFPGALKSDS